MVQSLRKWGCWCHRTEQTLNRNQVAASVHLRHEQRRRNRGEGDAAQARREEIEKVKPCVYIINTSLEVRPFPIRLSGQEVLVSVETLTSRAAEKESRLPGLLTRDSKLCSLVRLRTGNRIFCWFPHWCESASRTNAGERKHNNDWISKFLQNKCKSVHQLPSIYT